MQHLVVHQVLFPLNSEIKVWRRRSRAGVRNCRETRGCWFGSSVCLNVIIETFQPLTPSPEDQRRALRSPGNQTWRIERRAFSHSCCRSVVSLSISGDQRNFRTKFPAASTNTHISRQQEVMQYGHVNQLFIIENTFSALWLHLSIHLMDDGSCSFSAN